MLQRAPFLMALCACVLAACGGGAGESTATGSAPSAPAAAPAPVAATFREVGSFSYSSSGTALAMAALESSPGVGLLMLSGPTWGGSGFSCDPVGYRALTIDGAGAISDGSALLSSTSNAIHAREATVGDFNGDGRPDVYFGNHGCDNPPFPGELDTVFFNEGGRLVERQSRTPDLRLFTHGAASADLRGVGRDDILAVVFGASHDTKADPGLFNRGNTPYGNAPYFGSYLLRGNADGSLTYDTESLPDRFAKGAESMTVARFGDLDGDGRPDLVIGSGGNAPVAGYAYLNDGRGGFRTAEIALPIGAFGSAATIVTEIRFFEVGMQRYVLLLSTTTNPFYAKERATVLKYNGNAGFDDVTSSVLPGFGERSGWSQRAWFADLNGDGCAELIVSKDAPRADEALVFECRAGGFVPMAVQPAQLHGLTPLRIGSKTFVISVKALLGGDPLRSVKTYEYR